MSECSPFHFSRMNTLIKIAKLCWLVALWQVACKCLVCLISFNLHNHQVNSVLSYFLSNRSYSKQEGKSEVSVQPHHFRTFHESKRKMPACKCPSALILWGKCVYCSDSTSFPKELTCICLQWSSAWEHIPSLPFPISFRNVSHQFPWNPILNRVLLSNLFLNVCF